MTWHLLEDPDNRENKNAGNGGDLVKHTVYLATIRFLLGREPWSDGLFVRECHAGRGVYRISHESRRSNLACLLLGTVDKRHPVLLQSAQLGLMSALGCGPTANQVLQWYAGSALMNAFTLNKHFASNRLQLYEWLPETRRILRSVLAELKLRTHATVLPLEEQGQSFDGEEYISESVAGWGKQDLILLDPFAMWRQAEHQAQRDRYGAIIETLVARAGEAPSLILFWTWGQSFPSADGDLRGSAAVVRNGYSELRTKLHKASFHFIIVKWRWELQFAMWVVVPGVHLAAARDEIDSHCRLLTDHLTRNGYHGTLSRPQVEID
jgi:23S rRNA A2030 N6-methylase RlmJ